MTRRWKRENAFSKLEGEERRRARSMFVEEWAKLVGRDGLVREEGRLYVWVGRKRQFCIRTQMK